MNLNRRTFLSAGGLSLGSMALGSLEGAGKVSRNAEGGIEGLLKLAPKAKRVIYLFQSGGPAQIDLFDYKPEMKKWHGKDLPKSVLGNQRLTGFTNKQKTLPVASSKYEFKKYGQGGATISELLPHTAKIADELCFIKSVHTEAINHDPARTFMQTGFQLAGRPSMGSWVSYGLGSECKNLPAFMVLTSLGTCKRVPQPVAGRLWSSGFLPSQYSGVKMQSIGDPILYISNPGGVSHELQGDTLESLQDIYQNAAQKSGDPAVMSRLSHYEMAYKMQTSVPDLTDLSDEPESTFKLYGDKSRKKGTYAANCLLARRLAERGVRFIQLYHTGWDHHQNIPRDLPLLAGDTDQPTAGLITDLKQRGLLEDTLVVWGGEFGRTSFCQGKMNKTTYGRDHHPRCFTMWMAGAGIKGGTTYGSTDDFSYNIAEKPVHIHDIQATILQQLGIDHTSLTHRYQGREFRLTDVHGKVIKGILA